MLAEEKKFLVAIEGASDKDKHSLIHALEFAKKAHEGQIRKSGDPYVIHVIDVGRVLWEKFHDVDLSIGGLLHDTVEDVEDITMDQIYKEFGDDVGFIVDAASKDEKSFYLYPDQYFEDKIERQLWAGMKDLRALLVKIADRDHNISTLQHLQPHKQIRMTFETQAIHKPLHDILRYDEIHTLVEANTYLKDYLANNSIATPAALKQMLLETCFDNFEEQLYGLVYNNSNTVIWIIEDKALYEKLIETSEFNDNVATLSLWTDSTKFHVSFYFKKGILINEKNTKMKIHTFKQQ